MRDEPPELLNHEDLDFAGRRPPLRDSTKALLKVAALSDALIIAGVVMLYANISAWILPAFFGWFFLIWAVYLAIVDAAHRAHREGRVSLWDRIRSRLFVRRMR